MIDLLFICNYNDYKRVEQYENNQIQEISQCLLRGKVYFFNTVVTKMVTTVSAIK